MTIGLSIFSFLLGCGDKDAADTAPPAAADDTGSGTGLDTADTGAPPSTGVCATPGVYFELLDGTIEDYSAQLTSGEYLTINRPGTLMVCPGTWYARMLIEAEVDIVGMGDTREETVLSGGLSGTIIDISVPVTATVSNLTLDRGIGLDVDHNSGGGGIYCENNATVIVDDVLFTNSEGNDGAGMYGWECDGVVSNSLFTDNVVEDDGGAISWWYNTLELHDVDIIGNIARDGGAMTLFNATFTASNLNVSDNAATYFAGGIWVYDSDITVTDSVFSGNTNEGFNGGGMLVYGSAELDNIRFDDNEAPFGGGLYVYFDAEITATAVSFSGNTVDDIWVAGYNDDGGVSMAGSEDMSFTCAENTCTEN